MKDLVFGCVAAVVVLLLVGFIWVLGSENPFTPAGYIGYVTQGSIMGSAKFLDTQDGPTSYGRTWLAKVINVSITPYTYEHLFDENSAVLAKDSVKIKFAVHVIWKVRNNKESIRQFVEHYTTLTDNSDPGKIVQTAYDNFVREPVRTSARNEIQQFAALEIKDNIVEIGKTIETQIRTLCKDTPFEIIQIVVGNIQYPDSVANAVAEKMATTQRLEQKKIEIEIATQDAKRRIAEADGIAKSMEIINQKLTDAYIQYLAIEAQKLTFNSPNHTTIYIPVGPMGVPIVNTISSDKAQVK